MNTAKAGKRLFKQTSFKVAENSTTQRLGWGKKRVFQLSKDPRKTDSIGHSHVSSKRVKSTSMIKSGPVGPKRGEHGTYHRPMMSSVPSKLLRFPPVKQTSPQYPNAAALLSF